MDEDDDELVVALERYARATPYGDKHLVQGGPVESFPRLPPAARSSHPSQWVRMMRSLARLYDFPADNAEILGFEAATYLVQQSRGAR